MGQNTPGLRGSRPLASSLRRLERANRRAAIVLAGGTPVNQAIEGFEVQIYNPHTGVTVKHGRLHPTKGFRISRAN